MGDRRSDAPDSGLVDGRPKRPWLGAAVEVVTGLCYLLGILVLLVVVSGSKAVPAWVEDTIPLLFIGGTSWGALVGGLLLVVRPRAMAGTQLELLVLNVWGAFWAAVTVLLWAIIYRGLHWQWASDFLLVGCLLTGVPFIMLALEIPPVGRRRRSRTTSQQWRD